MELQMGAVSACVCVCVCVRSVRLKDITSTMRSGICVRGVTVRDEVGGKGKGV